MNDRHANRPGADPSKDLPDQIPGQNFPLSGFQHGCGQQLQSYGYCRLRAGKKANKSGAKATKVTSTGLDERACRDARPRRRLFVLLPGVVSLKRPRDMLLYVLYWCVDE